MMRRGPKTPEMVLSMDERHVLERWSRRPSSAQALAMRARLILACADGKSNRQVAEEIGVCWDTVGKWRQRFVTNRVDGLLDEPRPGAPRQIADEDVERVIGLTLETTPVDATHWSTRSMARRAGLSQSAISPYLESICPATPSDRDLQTF